MQCDTEAINSKWDFKSEWKYNRGLHRSGLLWGRPSLIVVLCWEPLSRRKTTLWSWSEDKGLAGEMIIWRTSKRSEEKYSCLCRVKSVAVFFFFLKKKNILWRIILWERNKIYVVWLWVQAWDKWVKVFMAAYLGSVWDRIYSKQSWNQLDNESDFSVTGTMWFLSKIHVEAKHWCMLILFNSEILRRMKGNTGGGGGGKEIQVWCFIELEMKKSQLNYIWTMNQYFTNYGLVFREA